MKKIYLFATALVALASCTDSEFLGDNSPTEPPKSGTEQIQFGFNMQNMTRGDIAGNAAADLLGGNFYVVGTKGTEGSGNTSPNIVFNNYLVHYGENTAGKTESNTANWEYVGVTPGSGSTANYVKLSPATVTAQSIKFWDYSTEQYDFHAFSTGSKAAVSSDSPTDDQIGVTTSKYGAGLAGGATAYTLYIPTVAALGQTYITDIVTVAKASYGNEVTLKFKNIGSKVRIALYETVPGYSVKDVQFYQWDGTTDFATGEGKVKGTTAALISANTNGLPTKGTIDVYFPHLGTGNSSEADYKRAATRVTPVTANSIKAQTFSTLHNFANKQVSEAAGDIYLGRSLPNATYAGNVHAAYYQTVFPVTTPDPLTLRVDYTLVSTDGSGEEITVYGAKAVVPSTYTKWEPNYAYTYIFKISENTNGWTDTDHTASGLFPITFDAVVTEATDVTGQQATITTVSTPTITTYQQNHDIAQDEYSIATGKKVYVRVMDNKTATATLVTTLSAENSLLYAVSKAAATEAEVMDALQKRTTAIGAANVTGRNGIGLTKDSHIDNTVEAIVNGANDDPIAVAAGSVAEIDITALSAGTYAYVYDYTSGDKTVTTIYQPVTVAAATIPSGTKYVTKSVLNTLNASYDSNKTGANEDVNSNYLYFSRNTTDGGTTWTYSFVSVDGKAKLPAGLLKVEINSTNVKTSDGTDANASGTFCFDTYLRNNGKYAVKIIKIVA